jgi:hypothetical protein
VTYRALCVSFALVSAGCISFAQQVLTDPTQEPEAKRILGIVPNYRTSPILTNYELLKISEKFKVASEDSFDRGTVVLGAMFGAEAQLTNQNRAGAISAPRAGIW